MDLEKGRQVNGCLQGKYVLIWVTQVKTHRVWLSVVGGWKDEEAVRILYDCSDFWLTEEADKSSFDLRQISKRRCFFYVYMNNRFASFFPPLLRYFLNNMFS